ncbi:NADH dehydrogenase subunit E [Maritimibacter alkaliphilus HTCC2654]|uniref:NADH:ubiquinone oxidoreductase 41 kD complex I subunit n=1 Tax=Maritimibacter alkaliphilus HTCC2654 TaxID=314271 RepID=A3VI93_9RHOB|nr:NADH-quinone oxidoreductase subunit E [Maritimibacter alkaliphilus]EAQ12092.1 NADH:ubiquinone oxidoreductase 41 kD complex I subunit [Rhodobacterales bacterium HTCC2654] [Maritimibacter alkaliphilus HTCC2654]TYP83143.1 NADH dehydrogenase subunit E [Maritimibacter alkaliphilus HTCC2654]
MLRRLHHEQPASFAFTPDNQAWAEAQMTKYPEGRQASAIIPLLWRAQEQEGWLTKPAIEGVADMLGMEYIRALEVATFYFMFQLQPVGSVAHFQICGTTSCMIMGAEDLIAVCKEKIAPNPHELSADGKFSWEEVECLGSCANAPMAQIGKDYYEDLTTESFGDLIDRMGAGEVPLPGPQNGRYASEPAGGLTSLKDHEANKNPANASVALATDIGDTLKRIDGTEVPLTAPWQGEGRKVAVKARKTVKSPGDAQAAMSDANETAKPKAKATGKPAETTDAGAAKTTTGKADDAKAAKGGDAPSKTDAPAMTAGSDAPGATGTPASGPGTKPRAMKAPRKSGADDLKAIKGVGPKLETMLNGMGFYHYDQIAKWSGEEIAWVDQNLEGFKGRVSRDNWVDQAKTLAEGGETEFSKKVKKGDVY